MYVQFARGLPASSSSLILLKSVELITAAEMARRPRSCWVATSARYSFTPIILEITSGAPLITMISLPVFSLFAWVSMYFHALENGMRFRILYSPRMSVVSCKPIDFKIADSVGLPKTSVSFEKFAVEFIAPIILNRSSSSFLTLFSTTVMQFWVRVPVLSVKITFTAPMVSQACIFFTRLFSFAIVFIENASAMVTESGKPSGTATITITTAPIRNSISVRRSSRFHANSAPPSQ